MSFFNFLHKKKTQQNISENKALHEKSSQKNTSENEILHKKSPQQNTTENDGHMRKGNGESLANTFIDMTQNGRPKLRHTDLVYPHTLDSENILAVHYADGGAQGEAGAVRLLYRTQHGIQILYGNYVYGKLNLSAVIEKLPMLKPLDSRFSGFESLPYPFGGKLEIPDEWRYLYMGAMNHYYVRREISEEASEFIEYFFKNGGAKWFIFEAIAWLYGMEPTS